VEVHRGKRTRAVSERRLRPPAVMVASVHGPPIADEARGADRMEAAVSGRRGDHSDEDSGRTRGAVLHDVTGVAELANSPSAAAGARDRPARRTHHYHPRQPPRIGARRTAAGER